MLKPVNRYILIDIPLKSSQEQSEPIVILPDDYRPTQSKFAEVIAEAAAEDVRFNVNKSDRILVDRSMIEEISVGGTIYNVILDNYVVGIVEN